MLGLGGTSTLGLGIAILLRDGFTAKANNVSKSAGKINKDLLAISNTSYRIQGAIGAGLTTAGYKMTQLSINATKQAMEFEKAMVNVKALGEMSSSEQANLANLAQTLGPKFGKGPIEAAQTMETLVKAGMKAKEIPEVLKSIFATSVGADEGSTVVADKMIDMLMAWGRTADDAAYFGDVLAKATIKSTINFSDIAESMEYAQNTLTNLNLGFEESVALIAMLGNVGIKGSKAGIALQNMFGELAIAIGGKSKKKNDALARIGLDPSTLIDAEGNLKRPLEVLEKIKAATQGLGTVEKENILYDIFGRRGGRGASPLLNYLYATKGVDKLGESLTDMTRILKNESAGSNMRIFSEKMKSAAAQTDILKANWEKFMISMGNLVIPMLNRVLPLLTKALDALTNFIHSHPLIGKMVIALGPLLTLFGGIMTAKAGMGLFFNMLKGGILGKIGVNAAGNLYNKGTGQMIKGGLAWFNKGTLLGNIFGTIYRAGLRLLPWIFRFAKGLGWVGVILTGFELLGFDVMKGIKYTWIYVKWALLSLGNVLATIAEKLSFGFLDAGPGDFFSRQRAINNMNFGEKRKNTIDISNPNKKPIFRDNSIKPGQDADYYRYKSVVPEGSMGTTLNIYLDGVKTISKKINSNEENHSFNAYGLS